MATGWESSVDLDRSIDNAVAAPEVVCLYHVGRTEGVPACTASRGIGHPTGKLVSEEGRRIFSCTRSTSVAGDVGGFGDRQRCPRKSRHSSNGAARHRQGRGTAAGASIHTIE